MRELAKWGLVEDAGGGSGRERPLRARGFSFAAQPEAGPDEQAAAGVLLGHLIERGRRRERDFVAHNRSLLVDRLGHRRTSVLADVAMRLRRVHAQPPRRACVADRYRFGRPPPSASAGAHVTRHTNPWLVLVLVCLAQFMVVLDATVVNVALPSIQKDLGMSEADLQWVVNSYTLVFGGFLLLGGRMGDLLGRKRIFLAGVAIFTVASLLDGLASSSGFLIAARGLQGLGGALVSPAALSIVTTTFEEGPRRAKALSVWAGIASGGAAVGLLLGGILTDLFSWPWIFFINVPIGIAAFLLTLRYVPESRDAHARTFDVAGAVAVTGGLVALVYAIVKTTDAGWTSAETLISAAIALVLLAAFVVIEQRREQPLVRLSIFRVRTITAANVVMLLVASGLFAMFFFNSLYIQRVLGYTPLQAGLAFLPFTVGIGIGAGASSQLAQRVGVRPVTAAGMLLGTVGLLLLARVPVDGSYVVDLLPSILVTSIGMGATFVPVTMLATSGVEGEDAGLASGLFNTSQQVGGALGLAVLSTAAVHYTTQSDGQGAQALVDGFHAAFLGGAVLMVAALFGLFLLLRREHLADVGVEAEPATAPVGNL